MIPPEENSIPASPISTRLSLVRGKVFKTLILVTFMLVFVPLAEAQQQKNVPRIGYVSGSGDANNPNIDAFRQGLRDLGYIEGKNILIEYRYAEGKLDRVPSFVAELVQLKVDVVVSGNLPGIRAAKEATKTIPIVMVLSVDPVATGIVDSLARPGGNITGLATLRRDLGGKRLELLTEVIPRISRVGVLWDANAPGPAIAFKEYEAAARALKKPLQSLEVRGPNPHLEGAFRSRDQRTRKWAYHDCESRAQPLSKADRGACD